MEDYLNTNLKSLIQKVHDEGIEKGKGEAEHIIDEAKQQSLQLLKEAEQRIAKIEEKSVNEMNRIRENLNSELKTVAQQAVSTIKGELAAVISSRITAQGISDALNEKEFLQKMIFTVLQKWNPAYTNLQFEVWLNKDDEAQLQDFFEHRIKNELAAEVEIVIENKIKSGFKISVKNENYHVSFSGEDFESFFKSYLRKKTLEWIYGINKNEHE